MEPEPEGFTGTGTGIPTTPRGTPLQVSGDDSDSCARPSSLGWNVNISGEDMRELLKAVCDGLDKEDAEWLSLQGILEGDAAAVSAVLSRSHVSLGPECQWEPEEDELSTSERFSASAARALERQRNAVQGMQGYVGIEVSCLNLKLRLVEEALFESLVPESFRCGGPGGSRYVRVAVRCSFRTQAPGQRVRVVFNGRGLWVHTQPEWRRSTWRLAWPWRGRIWRHRVTTSRAFRSTGQDLARNRGAWPLLRIGREELQVEGGWVQRGRQPCNP